MSFSKPHSLSLWQKLSDLVEYCASKQRAFGFTPLTLKSLSQNVAKYLKARLNMHGLLFLHIQGIYAYSLISIICSINGGSMNFSIVAIKKLKLYKI